MEATLKNRLLAQIKKNGCFSNVKPPFCVEIGLSGGVDSIVLAWLLVDLQLELGFRLCAVYVHHGLSPNAQIWADFCEHFCRKHTIPFRVAYVKLDENSPFGVEAEARAKRYQVYQESSAEVIALAHHRDDQIETVLLQLFRGGGVHALSGMPVCREDLDKIFWRPLISVSKADLVECARQNGLTHIDDESNLDEQFRRNWIRHKLLPEIEMQIPDVGAHILRTASLMQDSAHLVDEVVAEDLQFITKNVFFDVALWRGLSQSRQKMVLLRYVQSLNMGLPRAISLEDFVAQMKKAKPSDELCWALPDGKIYVYQEKIYPIKHTLSNFEPILVQDINDMVFANGMLFWQKSEKGIPLAQIKNGLVLSPRINGAMIYLNTFHKTVKSCLQERKIPPFMRQHYPILLNKDKKNCVAILNIKVAHFEESKDMKFFPCWRELL